MPRLHAVIPEPENAWDRWPTEGEAAFQAWVAYRDMPLPRSTRRVAEMSSKSPTLIARWSKLHNWVTRAALYDSHRDKLALQTRMDAIVKMEEKHARIAAGFVGVMAMPLSAIAKDRVLDDGTTMPRQAELERLSVTALFHLAESAARTFAAMTSIERLSRGAGAAEAPADMAAAVPRQLDVLTTDERISRFLDALHDAGLDVTPTMIEDADELDDDGVSVGTGEAE